MQIGELKSVAKRVPWLSATLRQARAWGRYANYLAEFRAFRRLAAASPRLPVPWDRRMAMLDDRTSQTSFDRHYIYHTAWAARVLAETRPDEHVDISSSLFFCGIVSAFVPVRFYDYRPADLHLSGLTSSPADLLRLPFADGSIRSLSCMHVVEHIGLGRYGDPLDPDGDLKAMRELERVLAPGGNLLFVAPVGTPAVCFNAHRIYSHEQIVDGFKGLRLRQFTLIPQSGARGGLLPDATPQQVADENYACGCFWFTR